MYISHKDHDNTIHVYSVTVMTRVKALATEQSSQGVSEPITPDPKPQPVERGKDKAPIRPHELDIGNQLEHTSLI